MQGEVKVPETADDARAIQAAFKQLKRPTCYEVLELIREFAKNGANSMNLPNRLPDETVRLLKQGGYVVRESERVTYIDW